MKWEQTKWSYYKSTTAKKGEVEYFVARKQTHSTASSCTCTILEYEPVLNEKSPVCETNSYNSILSISCIATSICLKLITLQETFQVRQKLPQTLHTTFHERQLSMRILIKGLVTRRVYMQNLYLCISPAYSILFMLYVSFTTETIPQYQHLTYREAFHLRYGAVQLYWLRLSHCANTSRTPCMQLPLQLCVSPPRTLGMRTA